MQHSQACLKFFLRNVSVVVVVSCYRCIRSTTDIGTREFPAEELLSCIQQLLRLGQRLAVDILGRHDVSTVLPPAGQHLRQLRHLAHVAHTVRRLDVAHLVVDVAAIVVSTCSSDFGTAASSFLRGQQVVASCALLIQLFCVRADHPLAQRPCFTTGSALAACVVASQSRLGRPAASPSSTVTDARPRRTATSYAAATIGSRLSVA